MSKSKRERDHQSEQGNSNPDTPGSNEANKAVERNRQEQLKETRKKK